MKKLVNLVKSADEKFLGDFIKRFYSRCIKYRFSKVVNLDRHAGFPPARHAPGDSPLAYGGKVNSATVLDAYGKGIFMHSLKYEPVLWWSPDPRSIILPSQMHIEASVKPYLKKYQVTFDQSFRAVINGICDYWKDSREAWINEEIINAFCDLHEQGYAHSAEVWHENELVGGLYGLLLGNVFFIESQFHLKNNASKVAMIALSKLLQEIGVKICDTQYLTNFLKSMGAVEISRDEFLDYLEGPAVVSAALGKWTYRYSGASLVKTDK